MSDRSLPACRRFPPRLPSGRRLRWSGSLIVGILALFAATPAFAYVGPGAGLSLLGALWGVAAAVVVALAFVVIWPVRRLIKRRAGPARAPVVPGVQPAHQTGKRHLSS
jgi:membrane protein implicated in regulation of membrane protease activity